MSISQSAACNVVPFLARVVLAAAFVTAGWNKIASEATFSGDDAATLRSLGVTGRPVSASAAGRSDIQQAAFTFQHAESPSAPPPAAPPAASPPKSAEPPTAPPAAPPSNGPGTPPSSQPNSPSPAPPATAPAGESRPSGGASDSTTPSSRHDPLVPIDPTDPISGSHGSASNSLPGDGTPLMARSLHRITLMVHSQGWPEPVYQAYAAVFVELVGGALLFLGLFSRLWALGLAVTMAVAFLLTSWPTLQSTSLFGLTIDEFNKLYCQAGLFVLAFGVMLTGAGALSLDRMIFRPSSPEGDVPA